MEKELSVPTTDKLHQSVKPCPQVRNLSFLHDLKTKHKFSLAVEHQNQVATTAIKSLDTLNDQIVQYIFGPSASESHHDNKTTADLALDPSHCQSDTPGDLKAQNSVQSSMVLIRKLLLDAQGKFRKMVEDNKQLAIRIDGSIQSANQEVKALRAELADTNRRLSEISMSSVDCISGNCDGFGIGDGGGESTGVYCYGDGCSGDGNVGNSSGAVDQTGKVETDIDEVCRRIALNNGGPNGTPGSSLPDCKVYGQECHQSCMENSSSESLAIISRFREENSRLEDRIQSLTRQLEEHQCIRRESGTNGPSYGELKLELIQSRQELNRAKEALQAMKSDRKRLKAEKVELLHQMKQLYATLEDKESELRDFIRNYEQRVRESDESIKQLAMEKEESEREKWEIIKKARESAERTMIFRTQLDAKEQTIKELEEEVAKLTEQLKERELNMSRESDSATPTPTDNDNGADAVAPSPLAVIVSDGTTESEQGSCSALDDSTSKDDSSSVQTSTLNTTDPSSEFLSPLHKWLSSSSTEAVDADTKGMKKKKKSFGSLSRVFSRGRIRRSIALPTNENLFDDGSGTKLSLLTSENYQEKLQTLEHMKGVHMCHWRAGQVLAWMEITLGMPMYGRNCALNVKSGKVLMGLSDSELGAALGVYNHIHRRKLRLAIEEFRNPAIIKFTSAPSMDPTWVSHRFLPDLGLPQYSLIFEDNLVDGRILNSLSRKDLEKHFDIHRKFHQASILHAIELLRRLEFDKEKLNERRSHCEDTDTDLLVWSCGRVTKWIKSIDLGEFADNLRESGVHGAMMVLEPSFTSDTLATALAIPPSKSYIRRHLATELDTLLRPARAALDTTNNNSRQMDAGSKSHTFTRSYRGQYVEDSNKGRLSFRGSLGRAFGKKIRDDLKLNFDNESVKQKISAPIAIQHSSLDNVLESPGDSTAV